MPVTTSGALHKAGIIPGAGFSWWQPLRNLKKETAFKRLLPTKSQKIKKQRDKKIMEYLKIIEEMGNEFEFDYKDGKGRFSVNINSFFKTVGSRDFKQFLDIVDMSSNPFSVAEKVQEIVFARYLHEKSFAGYQAYNEKLVNKLSGFLENLEKRYGFSIPEEEKQPEKIKFKKCVVFTFGTNNRGEREVNCYDGYVFKKFGLQFSVYKRKGYKHNSWFLTVPFCGMSLNSYGSSTKEEATGLVTEKIINAIFEQLKKPDFMEMVKLFQDLAKESNFAHLFKGELYAIPSAPFEESEKVKTEKEETATPEKPVAETKQICHYAPKSGSCHP